MNVLVTGGHGLIGRAVCEHIVKRGWTPVTFDRPNDVINIEQVRAAASECPGGVIHLAGVLGTHELFDNIHHAIDVNIKGSVNVLDACREFDLNYVGISMPKVFKSVYTATKVCTGWLASAYQRTYGTRVSHVTAFNAFGPGQAFGPGHPQKIVPTFALALLRDEPVPVWGDGEQTVDLIHTSDLARMLVDGLNFSHDEYLDGGTGVAMTVNEVVRWMAHLAGKPDYRINYLPMRRGEQPTNICATGEGWDLLDWKPELREQDMRDTIEWYRNVPV